MISKELLSLVLNIKVLSDGKAYDGFIEYYSKDKNIKNSFVGNTFNTLHCCYVQRLNLDTLTRLCKEWCEEQGYNVKSWIDRCHSPARQVGVASIGDTVFRNYFGQNESELEAVIKATEWVYKQKEK